MLRTVKPKNARVKRALEKKEPKVEENTKVALFVRGTTTSNIVTSAMKDLSLLKKPFSINFNKKNEVRPFETVSPLEFFAQKNDASLFCFGSHSKKRPNNLVMGRMYEGQVLDMVELGIENHAALDDFKSSKCAVGMKPCFIFSGDLFDTNPTYNRIKNLFLDFFRGERISAVNLAGLEYVITLTAGPLNQDGSPGKVFFRVYTVQLKKSGTRLPRVELEEMGPSFDFAIRRIREADDDTWKHATRLPKEGPSAKTKKVKNITRDELGDVYGRVHVGDQKLDAIQTRKMKGLKRATGAETESVDKTPEHRRKKAKESSEEEE